MKVLTVCVERLCFDVVSKLAEVELCSEIGEHQMFLIDEVWTLSDSFL